MLPMDISKGCSFQMAYLKHCTCFAWKCTGNMDSKKELSEKIGQKPHVLFSTKLDI